MSAPGPCGVCWNPRCNRPHWAEKLRFWLTDRQYDHLERVEAAEWRWQLHERLIERPLLRLLCLRYGHGDDFEGACVMCLTPGLGLGEHRRSSQ